MTTDTTTYRAAYLSTAQGGEIVLTGPEHAALSDAALRAEALAEARRGHIIDETTDEAEEACPAFTRAGFEAALCIGDWTA